VRAHLRRTQEADPDVLAICRPESEYRRTREVYRDKRIIELTAKEFDLLILRPSSPSHHPRAHFLERFSYDFMGDSNITVYIRYLRLVEANNEKRLLQTVRKGVGYVLRDFRSVDIVNSKKR